jgi:hypothetical protein
METISRLCFSMVEKDRAFSDSSGCGGITATVLPGNQEELIFPKDKNQLP